MQDAADHKAARSAETDASQHFDLDSFADCAGTTCTAMAPTEPASPLSSRTSSAAAGEASCGVYRTHSLDLEEFLNIADLSNTFAIDAVVPAAASCSIIPNEPAVSCCTHAQLLTADSNWVEVDLLWHFDGT
ncbi:hypothetical protein GOP47_0006913 [Adiantum capillus-veneris]|uniref:Uncharacterized protein n=1 Tax=Adiantum capillus-veneris TaxID=13818 RepID=A0A9D4UZY9_ADICA|nr:hypothetical protein GOP47_0006913 [Adiantum capillus-veneris]